MNILRMRLLLLLLTVAWRRRRSSGILLLMMVVMVVTIVLLLLLRNNRIHHRHSQDFLIGRVADPEGEVPGGADLGLSGLHNDGIGREEAGEDALSGLELHGRDVMIEDPLFSLSSDDPDSADVAQNLLVEAGDDCLQLGGGDEGVNASAGDSLAEHKPGLRVLDLGDLDVLVGAGADVAGAVLGDALDVKDLDAGEGAEDPGHLREADGAGDLADEETEHLDTFGRRNRGLGGLGLGLGSGGLVVAVVGVGGVVERVAATAAVGLLLLLLLVLGGVDVDNGSRIGDEGDLALESRGVAGLGLGVESLLGVGIMRVAPSVLADGDDARLLLLVEFGVLGGVKSGTFPGGDNFAGLDVSHDAKTRRSGGGGRSLEGEAGSAGRSSDTLSSDDLDESTSTASSLVAVLVG